MDQARQGSAGLNPPDAPPPLHGEYHASRLKGAVSHFLMGRTVSALANFLAAILVVRALAPSAYAVYLLLTGMALILGSASSLGLGETVQRFVPELYIRGMRGAAGRVMLRLLWLRTASLGAACLGFYAAAPTLSSQLELAEWAWAFRLACLMLLSIPLCTFLGVILESIMLQRQVKWIWVAVSLLRLVGIVAASRSGLELDSLLVIDAAAHGLGAVLAAFCLLRCTDRATPRDPAVDSGGLRRRMASFAFFNYLMALAGLFQSNAMNRVVAARFMPGYALAELCFAQAMADMVYRYMPQILLMNTVRPAIMARYAGDRDSAALNRQVNVFLKINLFLLAPLVLLATLCGDGIGAWISQGKYPHAGPLLAGFTILVAMQCHYRKLEMQAQAAERNTLLLAANLIVVFSLVPAALLAGRFGAWGILLAVMAGCIGRDLLLGWRLFRSGMPASPDWGGLFRLVAGAGGAWLILHPFSPPTPSPLAVLTLSLAGSLLFLGLSMLTQPFSRNERDLFNHILGRRIFPW
ncbi:MAG: hypothetical protein AB1916_08535 [Thermodesulfobacteriota bacterium]